MLGFGYCLMVSGLFCFLSFTSSVSLTSFYTEDEPIFHGLCDEQNDEHGSFFKFPEEMVVQCEIENSVWVFIVVEPATRIIKKKGLLLQTHPFKGRTIRKVMGGVGDFQLVRIFFFAHFLCRNFFFQLKPPAGIFF